MANVLEKIVADKRQEVTERERTLPLNSFIDTLVPSEKSLFAALSKPAAGFIFECKKASPSKGLIRPQFDLDEILEAYTPYASGISVLTDEKYFQGTYEYLEYVTARARQPVLNKDFFVAPYQVYLARYYHADAILLMLSVLDDTEYKSLATLADSLNLDILTEVSNEQEMARAIDLEAKIIGINNRNLRDLSTDLATTETLVPMLQHATHEYVLISESGIYTHQDVQRLSAVSNGFLVGSALMAESDLSNAVRRLIFGDTKVCGITQAEDAAQAQACGATRLGLIFAQKSPRFMTLTSAKAVVEQVSASYVGVFVNSTVDNIIQHVTSLQLAAVQLHGDEDIAFRQSLRAALPESVELWQAVALSSSPTKEQLKAVNSLINDKSCDRVLLDCKVGTQSGGTGQAFDWSVLNTLGAAEKIVLAGGIGEDNIAQAAAFGPSIIDINSKVESAPGKKDPTRIKNTLDARRAIAVHALKQAG
ncbi:bifunctional indole-3-glycerol-phosphate synthase TrpC/phosphoribosylanthranilate isomerase TrpF [Alteromonas sediminis]|uniref:Multifunctional fusion protein n=1 Tax=Alteromonas sediminis TaxID=2259342 RepID=A0A3N5Y0U1_9ALTE|nr:bifunctional indole-3-glycerol-phosphate synthase TrpC/phosphoribosylanthranilate isomerase TrpF [Alteromonas sediminis]RPJ67112.1 bifunctional indole-3-glycerol-phosphate synthase TrpC/phosphoribosylanthranilate isomerase TrpF [Alteromonas sediminis]